MPEPSDNPFDLFSIDHFQDLIGKSQIYKYFNDYLEHINAKTCICENDYIDRDYLIDYSKFYSRSFPDIPKTTKRYHFFSKKFTEDEFNVGLDQKTGDFITELKETYLGFIVQKPVKDIFNIHDIVGRTLLDTYPKYDGRDERVFIKNEYRVSLFGIPLKIKTVPFQQQDHAVGACATIACWTAHFPLQYRFDIPSLSPVEVTEKSVLFPSDARNFPSQGLTLNQMKYFFNSMGLDTEFIKTDISDLGAFSSKDDIIADVVKAYIPYGLPIIAGLYEIENRKPENYHAVVISGYRHNNGKVKELYLHDDNIGPYHRVKPGKGNTFNQWIDYNPDDGDTKWSIHSLFVPIYPKIRLDFGKIYSVFLNKKRAFEKSQKAGIVNKKSRLELFLTDVKEYKEYLREKDIADKKVILTMHLPRFLWIIRAQYMEIPHYDLVYDGTAVYPNSNNCRVDYTGLEP